MTPDVVLILIIIWTAKTNFNSVLARTIFAGLIVDFFSFNAIGVNVFSFVAVSFMVDSLCKRFVIPQAGRKFFILAAIIVLGTIVNYVIVIFIKIILNHNNFSWNNLELFNWNIILKPLYNLSIFIALYWPLIKIDKIFSQQSKILVKR
jgi:rod shape-determining protein MreD